MHRKLTVLSLCWLGLLVAPSFAQELLWQRTGEPKRSQHLTIAINVGDLDGDGHDDVAQTMERFHVFPNYSIYRESQIWLLSGRDGRVLRVRGERGGNQNGWRYRRLAATGDMDGDGVPDYATMVRENTGFKPLIVEVRSGKDDHVLWDVRAPWEGDFGDALLGGLDLDGDGKGDLVVSEPVRARYGAVHCYRNDGKLLYTILGDKSIRYNIRSARCLGKVGDLDADGADDFAVGVLDAAGGGAGARVHSGRTGKVLLTALDFKWKHEVIGYSVDGCGDVDGDGVPDFLAASGAGLGEQGVVIIFSGRTAKPLRTWVGPPKRRSAAYGCVVRSGGVDLDGDGVGDVLLGDWGSKQIFALSGRDGAELFRLASTGTKKYPTTGFGCELAILAPAPGSKVMRVYATERDYGRYGWPKVGGQWRGRGMLFRAAPSGVRIEGAACAGGLDAEPRIGVRRHRGATRVNLSHAPPAARALLLVGFSRQRWGPLKLPATLDFLGLPGCKLYTSVDLTGCATAGTGGIDRGYAYLDVPLALRDPGAGTVAVYAQWWVFDPRSAGFGFSPWLQWHVAGP